MADNLIEGLVRLNECLAQNEYSYTACAEIWAEIAQSGPSLLLLKMKHRFAPITPRDIEEWKQLILLEPEKEIHKMYRTLVSEYPTPRNYLAYLELVEPSEPILLEALKSCGHEFEESQKVWLKVVQFYTNNEDYDILKFLYKERLATPHKQIRETYDDYSQFVSSQDLENYLVLMKEAGKVVTSTEATMAKFFNVEHGVTQNPNDPSLWVLYLRQLASFYDGPTKMACLSQVFYRSLGTGRGDDWIPVWTTLLRCGYADLKLGKIYCPKWAQQFVKAFPTKCSSYVELLQTVESGETFNKIREQMEASKCLLNAPYAEWLKLVVEMITQEYRFYRSGDEQFKNQLLLNDMQEYGMQAISLCTDKYHVVTKLVVSVLEELSWSEDDPLTEFCVSLVRTLFEAFSNQADVWIYAFNFFVRHKNIKDIEKLRLLLARRDHSIVDEPEKVVTEVMNHLRLTGSRDEVREFVTTFEKSLEKKKRAAAVVDEGLDVPERLPQKKQKSTPVKDEEPKRSREQFRIKMTGLPSGVSEELITHFFAGYGSPLSVQIHNLEAIVELGSEQEVLTCLTRDIKPLEGIPVSISRIFANTLWITNYPASYGPDDVRKLIESFGLPALNVRFPSQNDNKERRFCYVDFQDSDQAFEAKSKLDGFVVDGFKIRAEISNPSLKKPREVPPVARQIYVHNLNFKKTGESALRQFFGADVEAVRIPLNEKNRSNGNKSNGYAFVTFTTENAANQALSLSGSDLDGRQIQVDAVKAKHNIQKPPVHFRNETTVSVQNVNEIVSSEQLKAYLMQKVGPVARIQLQPSKKAALVEFEKVADAGKASIVLEGTDFEDCIIHIGLKEEFMKLGEGTSAPKKPTMVPPMLMRRRPKK